VAVRVVLTNVLSREAKKWSTEMLLGKVFMASFFTELNGRQAKGNGRAQILRPNSKERKAFLGQGRPKENCCSRSIDHLYFFFKIFPSVCPT
jgi:hypothetical protein